MATQTPGIHAQISLPIRLPVTGSMVWNRVAFDQDRGDSNRFMGRIAAPFGRTAVGFGVGSWQEYETNTDPFCPDTCVFVTREAQSLVHHLYVQRYVAQNVFVRVATGYAVSRTVVSSRERIWHRPMLGGGGGWDLRLADYLFLTLSADWIQILGADAAGGELDRAVLLGVGLTLR